MVKNLEKKTKLRTASEVISRLKWSHDDSIATMNDTLIGYDCRINGPMEKCAADFNSIEAGGDIPEHRIQYFRIKSSTLEEGIFWDRIGRVDRLFGSGDGMDAPISPQTLDNAAAAVVNMIRLAEEKAIRAQEKSKQRARQYSKKYATSKRMMDISSANFNRDNGKCSSLRLERHIWKEIKNYHTYDSKSSMWVMETPSQDQKMKSKEKNGFKFITWNVLFDVMRDENNSFVQGDSSLLGDTDSTTNRWGNTLEILNSVGASIIALQEVTPRFVNQLQSQGWVKDRYALSSGNNDLSSLDPFGNLIMWRKDLLYPSELYVCKDLNRSRALIASLRFGNNQILNIANLHLPADKHNEITRETNDRTSARQRELGAILAKLQYLEQTQKNAISIPIILGDFNTDKELIPKDHFEDSWILSSVDSPGLTYDWKTNKRAQKLRSSGFSTKEPRRIDRIYVGNNCIKSNVHAKLIGNSAILEYPPSDHFGVSLTLSLQVNKSHSTLYDSNKVICNVWSKAAIPTTDSLLALIFHDSTCNGKVLHDKSSSLPLDHITLLNGFVDISSKESQKLAAQTVQDAVRQTLYSMQSSNKEWSLPLDKNSLRIFEHRSSATLVCCPNIENGNGQWLRWLYKTLRAKFVHCHQQESRFNTGWTPHFSLGSFTNTSEAREEMNHLLSKDSFYGNESKINIYGIGLFQRDAMDGQFYMVTSVPLVQHHLSTSTILDDAGKSASTSMNGISSIVLTEVDRACKHVTKNLKQIQLEATLQTYGSHELGFSLPGISDIDAVLNLKSLSPSNDAFIKSMNSNSFLEAVASRLSLLHKNSKIRIRVSNTGDNSLSILTVKLAHQYPSLDLLVCKLNSFHKTIDKASNYVMNVIKDSEVILSSIRSIQRNVPLDAVEVICGTLRIIKFWANQRQIYGTKAGFLGGGAWAILLLELLHKSDEVELLLLFEEATVVAASKKMTSYFFNNILSFWSNENVVTLSGHDTNESSVIEQAARLVFKRNSMAVLAPISGGNFGRSSTQSTTLTTKAELLRAQELLKGEPDFEGSFLNTFKMDYGSLLTLELYPPSWDSKTSSPKPSEVKAWGTTQMLSLLVTLERSVNPNSIRPISTILRKKASFVFLIGIQELSTAAMTLLNDFIVKQTVTLEAERKFSMPDVKACLSLSYVKDQ